MIVLKVERDDLELGLRAAKRLLSSPKCKDMIVSFGESDGSYPLDFFAYRGRNSIIVRPTSRTKADQ